MASRELQAHPRHTAVPRQSPKQRLCCYIPHNRKHFHVAGVGNIWPAELDNKKLCWGREASSSAHIAAVSSCPPRSPVAAPVQLPASGKLCWGGRITEEPARLIKKGRGLEESRAFRLRESGRPPSALPGTGSHQNKGGP